MNNPERPYSIGILDDIHLLFPEFLYDANLFPNNVFGPLSWLRYRMSQNFPQTYRRYRLNYEAMHQHSTRADYDDWVFLSGRPLQTPLRMPPYRNEFFNITPPPAPAPLRTWGGSESLGLLSLALSIPTENWLANFLDAVPIRPSDQDLVTGTEILQSASISQDVICTICQEHEQTPIEVEWRKIRGCGHFFHKTCIDRWFSRNTHCPVCRFDIRARTAPSLSSEQSSSETEMSPN